MSAAVIVDQKLIDGVQDLAVIDQVLSCLPLHSFILILKECEFFLHVFKIWLIWFGGIYIGVEDFLFSFKVGKMRKDFICMIWCICVITAMEKLASAIEFVFVGNMLLSPFDWLNWICEFQNNKDNCTAAEETNPVGCETNSSDVNNHHGVCAICLNKIVLQETALVKGCEHAYWFVWISFYVYSLSYA